MNKHSHPAATPDMTGPRAATPGAVSGEAPAFAGDPPNFIELGYGTGPRCIECRRNVSMCLCDAPEPEQEHFRPGANYDIDAAIARDLGSEVIL